MKQRIITAVVAAAIFLPIILVGKIPFIILMYAIASISLYEALKMRGHGIMTIPGLLSLALLWIFLIPNETIDVIADFGYSKMEFVFIAVLLLLVYTVITKNRFTYDDVGFHLLSLLYVGIGYFYFIEIRMLSNGAQLIFYALFIIWATDSGAYFIGRAMGKKKLWPHISPNKTVEGFIGGIVSAVIVGIIITFFTDLGISMPKLIIITAILSVFGQMGDLVESALKRHYGVKDSGNLLPGHGGMLDRFDSLLFVLPLLHFLL
ncbi:phosphatidate cytidylyltransferase [Rossellomorea marisflavi]|uniref:Phosphatidate cytidylyltransferase n=1 Tax=Rossellomorea marisflavi TaxID=189381 RepID=A0A5D4RSA3_9BACI|nr:phosphatidate cytidylyltransferase [Rossellomorea marisflavi]KQU60342.1 phosphatidate cytidylyltransferase [Bacillus sp. Leaf406]MBV6683283.1 phosphatidate cytidylyltransferase [Bacillus sp. JRC01]TYS53850.1 phosphatidate cytidylyltransferase [Rossellomorea marisflavi]UKS67164.1 phosphatidate cytidylyltransferase [Rossellomorea marisflavi]WJV17094.1 phosphatidate cytidylyltransferase [Rossellomorea marisflavi]